MAETKDVPVDVSAVASDSYLDSLKRRLDILEKKLLGKPGVGKGQPPLISTVANLQKKLDGLPKVGGSVAQAWQKIESLEELLNPERTDYLKLSEDAKAELLLSYAEQLKPLSGKIDEIQSHKDYLNTTEFQGLDNHEKKLAAATRVHTLQEVQVETLSTQIRDLTHTYHRIILQLSAQCVEWNEMLSEYES